MPPPFDDRTTTRWILLATLTGAALRAVSLEARPLWMDEALQIRVAHSVDLLDAIRTLDLHPPLLTLVLTLLPEAAPDAALRLPSWLASVACIPLAAWAARRWSGPDAARWAAWLAALLPTWILYGAEARPYALGLATTLGVLGAAASPSTPLLPLTVALAVGAQYGTWPVIACALLVAADRRATPAALGALTAAILCATLTFALLLPQQQHQAANLASGFLAPWFWTIDQVVPFTLHRTTELLGYTVSGVRGPLALGLGALLACAAWLGLRRDALTTLAIGPLVLFWLFAGLGLHPYGGLRQLLILKDSPACLLWTSDRLGTASPSRIGLVAAALLALWVRHPGLPVEDMPCLLAGLDDAPRLADAGARFAVAHYEEEPDLTWPWRSDQALIEATWDRRPRDRTWLIVTTSRRPAVSRWLDAWTADGGTTGHELACTGVAAIELLPP